MSPPSLRHPARLAGASLLRLQSDERLAGLAADGHEAAFDAIVDRYRTPLTRYCAGIAGPSRAEDAVQQALINAHDALQRTDEVRHLRSWLYRIAHNTSLNVLRAVRDDVSLDAASDATAVAEDGPAAAFERSERFRATVDALRELPERQRAALVLRELEGRSHEEIAEALGVTKGSARQHLMRARVALRGAVTAITPYPLIVRLAEMIASPGAGWTDAAVGAGAGATLAKLTAGVAATGALVGGAVGTERVVHHRHSGQDAAERSTTVPRPARARVVSLPATAPAGGGGASATGSGRGSVGSGADDRKGGRKDKNNDRDGSQDGSGHRGHDGSGGNKGSDDSSASSGSQGRGSSGSGGGSGHASDQSADRSGSGRHGGGGGDDGKRDGSSGSGSSGSRGDGSGRSKSSGSGSSGSSGDNELLTSGRGRGSSDDSSGSGSSDSGSGSGSSRDSGNVDSSSSTTTAAPVPAPTTTTPTDSSDSGLGSSGSSGSDDGSDSSERSGSSDRSGPG